MALGREREQEAFMKIKNSLLNNATLAYYEVGAGMEVIVDASPVGLGAMLTQKKKGGHRPVTYFSRSLSPVEQRYSRRNEKHWLFAGHASVFACTWLGTFHGRDRSQASRSHIQQLKQ